VIRTGWQEGGVPGGGIWKQGSVGKGQVKYCRAMSGGERGPRVDPGSIDERKQVS